jgi:hypothetical protein
MQDVKKEIQAVIAAKSIEEIRHQRLVVKIFGE